MIKGGYIDCYVIRRGKSKRGLIESGLGAINRDCRRLNPIKGNFTNGRWAAHRDISGYFVISECGLANSFCAINCKITSEYSTTKGTFIKRR